MLRCGLSLLVLLVAAFAVAGCGFLREEPELEDRRWPNGRYSARVQWLEVEMDLTFDEEEVGGSGFITRSPVDGVWENDELWVDLMVTPQGGVRGSWEADWGAGNVGGIMLYPLLGVRLFSESSGEEVAALRGSVQHEELAFSAALTRGDDTLNVELMHRGRLPVAKVDISGTLRQEDVVRLFVGPVYEFTGRLTDDSLDGSIEFSGVDRLRITLVRAPR